MQKTFLAIDFSMH